ncbi:MAG: carbohydrate-binding domain-containing protein [Muribaculaceae bacterium]|nr:carbohydrate-binding domain-containing protein [Muribaculaceae bacterium]MBR6431225.1 carbohydrate-binding domain-containing protein [Muribaculaceae bacterium]
MRPYILLMLMAVMATACVNDDTDFSDLINGSNGGNDTIPHEVITPIDIDLDFSPLDEVDDVVPTDETNETYNDYEENTDWSYTINISYDGETATLSGNTARVRSTVTGGHVVIRSTSARVNYVVSGTSDNGSLKIYSENKFKLTLNGLTLTNPMGAAINNQGSKSLYLVLADGTENTLTDGSTYTDVDGEDQKGALFSEGQVLVSGKGALVVNANARHGLVSDDYFRFRPGCKVYIKSAIGHGIKANDGITIDGGVFNIAVAGDGAKGIRCDSTMTINGGRTTIIATGGVSITPATNIAPADTSSCAGIKCDYALTINGGNVLIKATGEGGKGVNNTGDILVTGGALQVVTTGIKGLASPKGIKGDGALTVTGGYVYSFSANASPIDATNGITVADGYTSWETKPRRVIISFIGD